MSLSEWKRTIADGDTVIFYENYNKMQPVTVKSGQIFNNRFGHFYHSDIIGKPYGTRLHARKGVGAGAAGGFVTCLHPTAELWTQSLRHRTQILYAADISMILLGLNVRPGSVIVESGTGSGSLSTSFVRSCAPTGHVHTFEFNAERVREAKDDFARTGISAMIDVYHRNVCARGFPVIEGGADAVFLDLPTPWEVVESSNRILVPNGRFCSFSPCIEQVQRTCLALRQHKFTDIHTIECLLRTFDVQTESTELPPFDAELMKATNATASAAPQTQTAASSAAPAPSTGSRITFKSAPTAAATAAAATTAASTDNKKRDSSAVAVAAAEGSAADADSAAVKKQKLDPATTAASAAAAAAAAAAASALDQKRGNKRGGKGGKQKRGRFGGDDSSDSSAAGGVVLRTAPALTIRPFPIMRGHTGYLTFAVRHHLPLTAPASAALATAAAATNASVAAAAAAAAAAAYAATSASAAAAATTATAAAAKK